MNVGELIRERDQIKETLESVPRLRAKLKQLNVIIALYGEGDNVALLGERGGLGTAAQQRRTAENRALEKWCVVPDCDQPQDQRGFCIQHYGKFSRKTMAPELMKLAFPSNRRNGMAGKTTGRKK